MQDVACDSFLSFRSHRAIRPGHKTPHSVLQGSPAGGTRRGFFGRSSEGLDGRSLEAVPIQDWSLCIRLPPPDPR